MGSDVFCLTYFSNSHNINDSASSTQDSTLDVIAMKGVYPMKGYVALPSVMLRVDDLCRFYATESLLGTCAYVSVCVARARHVHGTRTRRSFFFVSIGNEQSRTIHESGVLPVQACRRPQSFLRKFQRMMHRWIMATGFQPKEGHANAVVLIVHAHPSLLTAV